METVKNQFVKIYTTFKTFTTNPIKAHIRGHLDHMIIMSLTFPGDVVDARMYKVDDLNYTINYYKSHMSGHEFDSVFNTEFLLSLDSELEQIPSQPKDADWRYSPELELPSEKSYRPDCKSDYVSMAPCPEEDELTWGQKYKDLSESNNLGCRRDAYEKKNYYEKCRGLWSNPLGLHQHMLRKSIREQKPPSEDWSDIDRRLESDRRVQETVPYYRELYEQRQRK